MNTNIYLAAATFAMIAAIACNKDSGTVIPDDGAVAVKITAGIGGVQTRAAGSSWAQDDAIGIFTVSGTKTEYANIPYKYDGIGFKPADAVIYFQSEEEVTFNAYYPFSGTSGTSAGTVTAATRAANQAVNAQPAIDFLYASGARADKTKPTVSFTDRSGSGGADNSFKHRMSQITLRLIEGDDMLFTGKLTSYTLKGLRLTGSFNTVTGTAVANSSLPVEDLTIALSGVSSADGIYTTAPLILFPQTVSGGEIALEVTVDGEVYKANLALASLESGNNYIFPVTVRKTGLSVDQPEIKGWTEVVGTSTDATM